MGPWRLAEGKRKRRGRKKRGEELDQKAPSKGQRGGERGKWCPGDEED